MVERDCGQVVVIVGRRAACVVPYCEKGLGGRVRTQGVTGSRCRPCARSAVIERDGRGRGGCGSGSAVRGVNRGGRGPMVYTRAGVERGVVAGR